MRSTARFVIMAMALQECAAVAPVAATPVTTPRTDPPPREPVPERVRPVFVDDPPTGREVYRGIPRVIPVRPPAAQGFPKPSPRAMAQLRGFRR